MSDYDASSIRVLAEDEIPERFLWAKAGGLAEQYPHVPRAFIERMLEACELSGMDHALAVARYLDGDRSVAVTEEFVACHTELSRNKRYSEVYGSQQRK